MIPFTAATFRNFAESSDTKLPNEFAMCIRHQPFSSPCSAPHHGHFPYLGRIRVPFRSWLIPNLGRIRAYLWTISCVCAISLFVYP